MFLYFSENEDKKYDRPKKTAVFILSLIELFD